MPTSRPAQFRGGSCFSLTPPSSIDHEFPLPLKRTTFHTSMIEWPLRDWALIQEISNNGWAFAKADFMYADRVHPGPEFGSRQHEMAIGPSANDSFQFISYFSTVLGISLLICLSFGGLFSRLQPHTEFLAALFLRMLFVSLSIFATSRPRSSSLSSSLPP